MISRENIKKVGTFDEIFGKGYTEETDYQFKSMKNKYCLACETFNFITEISFEYDPCYKKWQHIRGEQCRCK